MEALKDDKQMCPYFKRWVMREFIERACKGQNVFTAADGAEKRLLPSLPWQRYFLHNFLRTGDQQAPPNDVNPRLF